MSVTDRIRALPIWQAEPTLSRLGGGITNVNYLAEDGARRAVVRVGDDIAVHQILRFNELAASRAAHAAGISPAVLHHEPGLLVIDFIDGRTLTAADFADPDILDMGLDLVIRTHRDLPRHLRGASLTFWVFHVLRDYAATLNEARSAHGDLLPGLLRQAAELERAVGPIEMVYGHNDLLPANFLLDDARMWLVDWDYAGWGSPLFDLGGLAANNGLTEAQETHILTRYYGGVDAALMRRYRAMKAAAALRETMWSMVSELHSALDFDYAAYTATNLQTYGAALDAFRQS